MTVGALPESQGTNVRLDAGLANDPLALIEVCLAMADDGQADKALMLLEKAGAASDDSLLRRAWRAIASRNVPQYHRSMLLDRRRNAAYAAAIRNAGVAGKRVLDIGSGSGLLSMLAAREGAAEVVSCENLPAVADSARSIIAANGLSSRIRVVTGHSTKLSLEELGGQFDVVVSEILANDVVLEGVLPAIRDVHRRLLKPGGSVIPGSAAVRIAPARFRRIEDADLSDVEGFDVRLFGRHFDGVRNAEVRDEVELVGQAGDALVIDFTEPEALGPRAGSLTLPAPDTTADGLFQWIAIRFGKGVEYENPIGTRGGWGHNLWQFDHPAPAGEAISVRYWMQHDILRIWREAPA